MTLEYKSVMTGEENINFLTQLNSKCTLTGMLVVGVMFQQIIPVHIFFVEVQSLFPCPLLLFLGV